MEDRLFEDIETAKYYQLYRPCYQSLDIEDKVIPFLREKLKETPDSLAVDVGCGTGQLTRVLAPSFIKVIGADISEAQIRVAKESTSEKNIEYRVSSAEDLSFLTAETVDLVSVATALHYFDGDRFLKEVERILKPGGCLLTLYPSVPSTYYSMVPETENEETIIQCRLLMKEVSNLVSVRMGRRATEICKTGKYPIPNYQEKHRFLTTLRKPLIGLEGFIGFLKSIGSGIESRKVNPEKKEEIGMLQKKLEEILRGTTTTPETFKLYLTGEMECNLYRKPCRI